MENRQQQILSEIQSMMNAIRNELTLLDAKISEFKSISALAEEDAAPIELDTVGFLEEVVGTPEVEVSVVDEEPVEAAAPEVEEIPLPVEDDLPEDDYLPFFSEPEAASEPAHEQVPEPVPDPAPAPSAPILDAMADRQAWRSDMPGSPVKDIRCAISLNDRILFINKLFGEDPMAFQAAVNQINIFESLDDVIAYVRSDHPEWNLESDLVYRFMMAVRRKVR